MDQFKKMLGQANEEYLSELSLNKFFTIAGINPEAKEVDIDHFLAGLEKKSV